jgi:hypothetical protein
MNCNTTGCARTARYLIIEDRQTVRYCLPCIEKIKEREHKDVLS